MRINQNIYSLNIFKNYTKNVASNSTALERIASGKKINSAKDNPIKVERSENINIKLRSLQKASQNTQDGISTLQIVDTTIGEIEDALIRMRELSVQASSDNYSDEDRVSIKAEIEELKKFIDDTAESTEVNGNKLIGNKNVTDNSNPEIKKSQIGAEVGETIDIPYYNLSCDVLGIDNVDVINNPSQSITMLEKAISDVAGYRSKYGAIQNRMEESLDMIESNRCTYEKNYSEIVDADVALEMLEVTRTSILMESSLALMAQSNNFPRDVVNMLSGLIK